MEEFHASIAKCMEERTDRKPFQAMERLRNEMQLRLQLMLRWEHSPQYTVSSRFSSWFCISWYVLSRFFLARGHTYLLLPLYRDFLHCCSQIICVLIWVVISPGSYDWRESLRTEVWQVLRYTHQGFRRHVMKIWALSCPARFLLDLFFPGEK